MEIKIEKMQYTTPKLSILICTLNSRPKCLRRLLDILEPQCTEDVELLIESDDGEMSTGAKRNLLLEKSTGQYVCFIDDDDIVSKSYVRLVLEGCDSGADCISFRTIISFNGKNSSVVYNSLQFTEWWDVPDPHNSNLKVYFRSPQHLNPVKRKYALSVKFPDQKIGEDHEYSKGLTPLLKTEFIIPHPLYHYLCGDLKE